MKQSRVMVISAHASDFCSRCGGTLAIYKKEQAATKVLLVTLGERGESPSLWNEQTGITEDEVKAIRWEEARKSAEVLGLEIECLDFGDNPLVLDRDRLLILTRKIRQFAPDIILTHGLTDPYNPDHEVVGKGVLRACHYATVPGVEPDMPCLPSQPRVYFYEPDVLATPLSKFEPTLYIDITEVWDIKMKALSQFVTQRYLADFHKMYGEFRGFHAKNLAGLVDCKFAEPFHRYQPWGGKTFEQIV
jgi:4-oxalomesaconate hydratase